ncbi:MAG: endonuclease MutS2 [Oscillospiraceae bacterium]|jgi:DNA mismatch repair protein MutS2|nr:endonuclease MutS2 [Oscillospiraceae bacterium]
MNREFTEKSLRAIELPRVLANAALHAGSDAAKELIRVLRPSPDAEDAARLLRETSDALRMTEVKAPPGFGGVRDIRAALSRAKLGGQLNTRELLNIAAVLRATREISAYGEGCNNNLLAPRFWALRPNRFLEDKISGAIISEDEIADKASPELNAIRRHINAANGKVRDILQKIISSPTYQKVLQENIITQRGGRFVVPVRAEHKGAVPGIVHDASSSGATLFIEPMTVVRANNEIRELEYKEKAEIDRILSELSADAANFADDILTNWETLTALDVIFAKAEYSAEIRGTEPILNTNGEISVIRARHPLLPRSAAVPINITLTSAQNALVITGPNTGGKTVSLKTIGLLCAMAACGICIPADSGSKLPVFSAILADIGDEQSIEQSLSTFSGHMTNIVEILNEIYREPNVLVLLDELGAGTDPAEGAALAIAIIEFARNHGAKTMVTTHYAELKMYALQTSGVENASCEFDVETLQPTYRLITGIPGKSNAFAISSRLGLMPAVIEDAKARLDRDNAEFDAVIAALQDKRRQLEYETEELRREGAKLERERSDTETLRKSLEEDKLKSAHSAKLQAESIIEEARAAVRNALEIARTTGANPADAFKTLNDAENALSAKDEEEIGTAEWNFREIRVGDVVRLLKFGTRAEVTAINADGDLELRAGILTVRASANEVRLLEDVQSETQKYMDKSAAALSTLAVTSEIDLRGMDSYEAVNAAERYLESAVQANLLSVRIIHGKGTGALRTAVQNALKKNKLVKKFRMGSYGEGDAGVTVVEL